MYKKAATITFCALLLNLTFQGTAYSLPTKWEVVNINLSSLLDSGWQLIDISSHRVASKLAFSPGGLDEKTYVFSLTKSGKHIVCVMPNPIDPVAQAGCRRLN